MAVASGIITLVSGNTVLASDHNTNYTILKNSVNNVVADQITDGTITNAEISASAEIAMSKITATASDANLVNAMENYLDGCYLKRDSDTVLSVSKGVAMINGELRRNTSATTNTPSLTLSKWNDVFLVADSAASTFTLEVIPNLDNPGDGTAAGTNTRRIGSIYTDATTDITGAKLVQYRPNRIIYLGYVTGTGGASATFTIVHGGTFLAATAPVVTLIGDMAGTTIAEISEYTATEGNQFAVRCLSHSTTQSVIEITEDGTISNGSFHGFIAVFEGSYT